MYAVALKQRIDNLLQPENPAYSCPVHYQQQVKTTLQVRYTYSLLCSNLLQRLDYRVLSSILGNISAEPKGACYNRQDRTRCTVKSLIQSAYPKRIRAIPSIMTANESRPQHGRVLVPSKLNHRSTCSGD